MRLWAIQRSLEVKTGQQNQVDKIFQSKQAAIANNFDRFNKKGTREEIKPTVAPSKIKSKFINEDEQKMKESLKHLTLESSESDSDWRSTNSGYADLPTMIAENDLGTMKRGKRLDFNVSPIFSMILTFYAPGNM